MKPTNQCKLNYIIKNYFKRQIPSMAEVNNKYKIAAILNQDISDFFYEILLKDDHEKIIKDILSGTPEWSCVDCVNKYACELKGTTNETYIKM